MSTATGVDDYPDHSHVAVWHKPIVRGHGFEHSFCSMQLAAPNLVVRYGREKIRRPGELVVFDPQHPVRGM
jgi:hypothetical protein